MAKKKITQKLSAHSDQNIEEPGKGHNSQNISKERLVSIVQRLEKLHEDKAAVGEDIKEVFSEAKGAGFDTQIIRIILRQRRMKVEDFREQEELLDVYRHALGMLHDTPLGKAALDRAGADELGDDE